MSMLIAQLLATANAAPMQPVTRWVVEFADSTCLMGRRYGTDKNPIDLLIKAPMLGEMHEVLINVPQGGHSPHEGVNEGWFERPNGTRAAPISAATYRTEGKTLLTRFYIDPKAYKLGEDGDRLILDFGRRYRYDFALPDLEKAKGVLGQCLTSLRDAYGVGESATKQIATPAESKLSIYRYFSTDDYPSDAVSKGERGYVGALFWVEIDGTVEDCKIVESSRRKSLDDRTCDVIRTRSRFNPAIDHQGMPIRSPQYQRVRWEMPG